MRKFLWMVFFLSGVSGATVAGQLGWQPPAGRPSLALWPRGVPGGSSHGASEADLSTGKDDLVAGNPLVRLGNVSNPTLTFFAPKGRTSGAAVVVFPGGAYQILAIDLEGTEVCEWLNTIGVACVLVKYRVPDSGPLPKSAAALEDAQRALGVVRAHASEWHIDPQRIGVLGFSAGAHLAAALSTHFEKRLYNPQDAADALSCRPDFAVLVYPAYLALAEQNFAPNPEIRVSARTPPSFIVQSEDDPVHSENATVYFQALKAAGVPAELHIYAEGGHGYGLRPAGPPVTAWPRLVETWLRTARVLPGQGTDAWKKALPSSFGVDEKRLDALDRDIAAGKFSLVDSFKVVRCDRELYERRYVHDYAKIYGKEAVTRGPLNARLTGPYNYFDPAWHPYYRGTDLHTMQSVSKSVTSAIFGIAISRGDFRSGLDTPLLRYFDASAVKHVDDRKRRMTLRHVLTMTTGLDWNEDVPYDDPRSDSSMMEALDDWVAYVVDKPMAQEPGKVFNYSSGASELLAYVFQKETGQDIEAYGEEFLFRPLGISHYWKRTPLGLIDTEGGLYLNDDGLARFGSLYLHKGLWNGRRILSEEWIRQSLAPFITAKDDGAYQYGFQWWLFPREGAAGSYIWMARGFGGQRLMVFPEEELIVVLTGWDILGEPPPNRDLVPRILAAVKPSACPAD
jgi:CubicO group peptidase (beta-lactamase class C family)/acetyl esterase/lipase